MIGHGAKMQELYQERILELARTSKHSKPIDNPTHRAEKNNPICGDKVIINATIKDNMVYDAHLTVRGCALCEAGAGIWKETAVGKEVNELNLLRDELGKGVMCPGAHGTERQTSPTPVQLHEAKCS